MTSSSSQPPAAGEIAAGESAGERARLHQIEQDEVLARQLQMEHEQCSDGQDGAGAVAGAGGSGGSSSSGSSSKNSKNEDPLPLPYSSSDEADAIIVWDTEFSDPVTTPPPLAIRDDAGLVVNARTVSSIRPLEIGRRAFWCPICRDPTHWFRTRHECNVHVADRHTCVVPGCGAVGDSPTLAEHNWAQHMTICDLCDMRVFDTEGGIDAHRSTGACRHVIEERNGVVFGKEYKALLVESDQAKMHALRSRRIGGLLMGNRLRPTDIQLDASHVELVHDMNGWLLRNLLAKKAPADQKVIALRSLAKLVLDNTSEFGEQTIVTALKIVSDSSETKGGEQKHGVKRTFDEMQGSQAPPSVDGGAESTIVAPTPAASDSSSVPQQLPPPPPKRARHRGRFDDDGDS